MRNCPETERYEDYDEDDVPVRRSKGHGKGRRQGALTNLLVYGQNRRNGAENRLRRMGRAS